MQNLKIWMYNHERRIIILSKLLIFGYTHELLPQYKELWLDYTVNGYCCTAKKIYYHNADKNCFDSFIDYGQEVYECDLDVTLRKKYTIQQLDLLIDIFMGHLRT